LLAQHPRPSRFSGHDRRSAKKYHTSEVLMKNLCLVILFSLSIIFPRFLTASDFMEIEKKKNEIRAKYWSARGYNFNPDSMTAFMMDQKVKDIERAKYWQQKGHNFNPDTMTAFMMDQKVKDIDRARFWQGKGFDFNPDTMTAFMMDQKVKDIERAKYWQTKGHSFNPDTMTAFMMDQAVKGNEPGGIKTTRARKTAKSNKMNQSPEKEIVYVPVIVPSSGGVGNVYIGVGDETSIQSISDGGRIITLLDNSVWEVNPIDTVDTAIWLPVTDVLIIDGDDPGFPYKMINKDDNEVANVKLLSQ